MNKQVYYWCTVIVIAVVVVIGFLTVSDNGNTSNNQSIYNETEQNVGTENKDENTNITVEENNLTNYLEDQTTIMDKMLTEMKNIPHVGNPAIDFLYGMTLHHESAIAMAESYLKYGGNHAELKQMANDDERIIFTGFVQGHMLEELYSNAYIYTLPSDLEGMPLSLLEGMSYGNCCLISDIEECTGVVGDYAVTFRKSNVEELRNKLQMLCDDEMIVQNYKLKSADYICEKYNWDNVVTQTLSMY